MNNLGIPEWLDKAWHKCVKTVAEVVQAVMRTNF
jgi:hypothetical protein